MSLLLLVVTRNREVSARKLKKLGEFWNGVVPEICGGVVGVYPKKKKIDVQVFQHQLQTANVLFQLNTCKHKGFK